MASPIQPKNDIEKSKILQSALEEIRVKFQNQNTDYSNLGSKIFTLIATELVITTFLLTFRITNNKPVFSLSSLAIVIFFGIGIACILLALGLLFWSTTSNKWASPAEIKELKLLRYRTHADYLEDIKDDYIEAYSFCKLRYNKRRVAFDGSVILFVTGAIILMVIKIGG